MPSTGSSGLKPPKAINSGAPRPPNHGLPNTGRMRAASKSKRELSNDMRKSRDSGELLPRKNN